VLSVIEIKKRATSLKEVKSVIDYWLSLGRTIYYDESSLINFLHIFSPKQIKGAMYIAQSEGRQAYFKYLCGILRNWEKDLKNGKEPLYFEL